MRLTLPLAKTSLRWLLKNEWRRKGVFWTPKPIIPKPYIDRGVEIVDAVEQYMKKEREEWTLPDPKDPRYAPPKTVRDNPNYHDTPVRMFGPTTRLSQGVKQAQLLTKTHVMDGVPDGVQNLLGKVSVPSQDELCERYILQANRWDATRVKLPRRMNFQLPGWHFKAESGIPNKRIASTIVRNMLRLCQSAGVRHPDLHDTRSISTEHYVSNDFLYNDAHIKVCAWLEAALTTNRPLPRYANQATVQQTTSYTLPELYPISPTLEITPEHVYVDIITNGFHPGKGRNLHTLVLNNQAYWSLGATQSQALLFCFSQALLQAKLKYGDGAALPQPVCIQAIQTNGCDFHFTYFQLNTRASCNPDGVKNLVWFDSNNALYKRIVPKRAMLRNTVYQDYDPRVLQKFIATYAYGANIVV